MNRVVFVAHCPYLFIHWTVLARELDSLISKRISKLNNHIRNGGYFWHFKAVPKLTIKRFKVSSQHEIFISFFQSPGNSIQ